MATQGLERGQVPDLNTALTIAVMMLTEMALSVTTLSTGVDAAGGWRCS
jgi:hypothetical protein